MEREKISYVEISEAEINENKKVIVSACSKGGYTIAQKVNVLDHNSGDEKEIFLKGAIQLDYDGMVNLRDALSEAIDNEEENVRDVEW